VLKDRKISNLTWTKAVVVIYGHGANFINILRAHFLYEILFKAKLLSREKLLKRLLYKKCARKMSMKLTPGMVLVARSSFDYLQTKKRVNP